MRAATIGLRSVPRVSPLFAAQLLRRQTRVWGKEIFVVWRFFLPTLVFVVWRFFLPTSEIKIAPTLEASQDPLLQLLNRPDLPLIEHDPASAKRVGSR